MNDDATGQDAQLAPTPADPALADLLPRQASFVSSFVDCGCAAQSARKAGYTCSSAADAANVGYRLLKDPKVAAAVRALRDAAWSEKVASRAERMALLSSIARGEPLNGGPPPTYAEMTAAAKLLAAMNGDLAPKTGININLPSPIVYMPHPIKDAAEWSRWAKEEMARCDAAAAKPVAAEVRSEAEP